MRLAKASKFQSTNFEPFEVNQLYEPHMKYDKNGPVTLKCFGNVVMMKFLDETGGSKGRFHGRAGFGIIVVASAAQQKKHRWAQVMALGPDAEAEGLAIGDYILVESMMWMEANTINGERWNKTDTSKILSVTDDREACQLQDDLK